MITAHAGSIRLPNGIAGGNLCGDGTTGPRTAATRDDVAVSGCAETGGGTEEGFPRQVGDHRRVFARGRIAPGAGGGIALAANGRGSLPDSGDIFRREIL